MTLVLAWRTSRGVAVLADTRFGSSGATTSTAGPKIFSAPIVLNKWLDAGGTEKLRLPSVGFAFAGNSSSGQTVQALAAACLQNLVAYEFDAGPTVEDVAHLYARCGVAAVNERRVRVCHDGWCYDAVVFGRDTPTSPARAFRVDVGIGSDASAFCKPVEIDFSVEPLVALGNGIEEVQAIIDNSKGRDVILQPSKLLQSVMDAPHIPSVDGYQQVALAAVDGVELHYTIEARWQETPAELVSTLGSSERVVEMRLMGFDLAELGKVGKFSPTANHFAP